LSKDDKTINKDYTVNSNFKGINKDMRRIREISIQAEAMYDDAIRLGNHAAYAFKDLSRSKRNSHRSQMTGLENIAESALKTSDIFDYIKKQTARFDYWRKEFPVSKEDQNKELYEALKNFLEQEIKDRHDDHKDPNEGLFEVLKNFLEQETKNRRDIRDDNTGFGEALKSFLEREVKRRRDRICRVLDIGDVTDEDKYKRQQIYLQLIRQFIRHLVVQYEYCASQEEESENGTNAGASAQNRRHK
jgi:hypothetical protein